ncbi:MAG: Type 1 glutamine amidotransferase-like domain-containing protein [Candidatus Levybacteria bacterium]|nr:Type 1 glutamine amidotransferase-like domain-containing protein [Candidatus Levybacteria bacterium]
MKRLFLTSTASWVAADIAKKINKKGPRLAFIKTASEAEEGVLDWLENDRNSLKKVGFKVTDYTITGKTKKQVKSDLKDFDVLFFSGGNTFYLLEKIQQAKCAKVITDFIKKGKIYIGSSAGSLVAGPDIYPIKDLDNIKKAPNIKGYKGLELVDFVIFPHWGNDKFKDRYLEYRLEHTYNKKNSLILLTDNSYVEVKNNWYKIVDVKK